MNPIPADLLSSGTMLASPSNTVGVDAEHALQWAEALNWRFDVKWDGVRCLAYVDQGTVILRNRNGVDITYRYPEVCAWLLETYPPDPATGGGRVFDGEVIALGPDGKPDFQRLSKRDRQGSPEGAAKLLRSHPVIFVAFDLLWMNGIDLRTTPYAGRRAVLEEEPGLYGWDPKRAWLSPASDNGTAMWQVITQQGLEGLIAKDPASAYHPRRDRRWIKIKVVHRASVIVMGWEEGTGKRKGRIGALLVGVHSEPDENGETHLIEVGKLGTGLTDAELAHLHPIVTDPAYDRSLVVEAEYANFTADQRLRFPSYKGIRTDIDQSECDLDQFARD